MIENQELFWNEFYKDINIKDIYIKERRDSFTAYYPQRKYLYIEYFFNKLIAKIENKRILSVGGGIDKVALYLANKNNDVVAVDLSHEAVDKTLTLAQKMGVKDNLHAQQLNWEDSDYDQEFDVVIMHDSLHHMDVQKALNKVYLALKEKGTYIGMEPICLLGFIRFLHKKFPFHPKDVPYIYGEIELSNRDLYLIKEKFSIVKSWFFQLFMRESVNYILFKVFSAEMIYRLTAIEFFTTKVLPLARYLNSYIVFKAEK